jgi:hypothetical protein
VKRRTAIADCCEKKFKKLTDRIIKFRQLINSVNNNNNNNNNNNEQNFSE